MKSSVKLDTGTVYSRKDLEELFALDHPNLYTGVFHPKGHDSIWLFITEDKPSDRTQYNDLLQGDILEWDGQTSGRTDNWIINHKKDRLELLIFYRKEKREFANYGFVYEGEFEYVSHQGSRPTHFILQRVGSIPKIEENIAADLEAIGDEEQYWEGKQSARIVNYYERNRALRTAAISIHGTVCRACGFSFEAVYGERGRDFIEVHHIKPVSQLGQPKQVDPATDMTVLCANCHRMIHRRREQILSVEELRRIIAGHRN